MDVEVAADLAAAERPSAAAAPASRRRRRRRSSPAGRAPCRRARRAVRRGAGQALDADRAAVLDQQPARLDAGADPGPGRDRARQVADVHAALGVDPAAVGAGAALDAVAGVAGDRAAGDAERRGALHRQLAVAAHPLGVERRHPQELLGLDEVGVEVARPSSTPCSSRQSSSTSSGARKQVPELITVVPPTTFADRDRDRRVALGDRQAARRGRASAIASRWSPG